MTEKFAHIVHRYEWMNLIMSAGLDPFFRRIGSHSCSRALRESIVSSRDVKGGGLSRFHTQMVLDIGFGTGSLTRQLRKFFPGFRVVGLDLTREMLDSRGATRWGAAADDYVRADAHLLPFRKESFAASASAFVMRHFDCREGMLGEVLRVLIPGGATTVIEMGRNASPLSMVVDVYIGKIMLRISSLFFGSLVRSAAGLIEETYRRFLSPVELGDLHERIQFENVRCQAVFLGSCAVVTGTKPMRR